MACSTPAVTKPNPDDQPDLPSPAGTTERQPYMYAVILESQRSGALEPLVCTRPLAQLPVANLPFIRAQEQRLRAAGVSPADTVATGARYLSQAGDAWLSPDALDSLRGAVRPTVLLDPDGYPLAWIGDCADLPAQAETLHADAGSFRVCYPWDLLRVNKELVGALSGDQIEGSLSDRATVEGHLVLGAGSRVLPGVFVEGNVIIGRDCKIGPNCYLRGHTSIGDGCHLGQAVEIKNSIVMAQTSIGHLSYCGDSVIGTGVNLGAGTITANLRHDGRDHMSMVGSTLVDTGRRKLGAVIGDDVHTGIHTSIYPGRKIWPGIWTRPGAIVRFDIGQDEDLGP